MDNRLLINNGISSELWEKVIVNLVILHYIIKVKTKIETFIIEKKRSFTFTQSKERGGRNDNLPNNAKQEEETEARETIVKMPRNNSEQRNWKPYGWTQNSTVCIEQW